jgi:hypothetical protein
MPIIYCIAGAADMVLIMFHQGYAAISIASIFSLPFPYIDMCSFTTCRAYNFSNINSARAFCQKHRSVYIEIVSSFT